MCLVYHDRNLCVVETLTSIFEEQFRVQNHTNDVKQHQAQNQHAIERILHFPNNKIKNTIPFLLYMNGEPYKVDGVKICFDSEEKKEKFVCFTTFIFRVTAVRGVCVVLELLKFRNHQLGGTCGEGHNCSPCCQVHCEKVEDLVTTGVCITVDASRFNAIQCLPAVSL